MKRKMILLLAFVLLFMLGACGKQTDSSGYYLYYLNMDATKIQKEGYAPVAEASEPAKLGEELLKKLADVPEDNDLRQAIPSTIKVNGCSFTGYSLIVDFGEAYWDFIGTSDEILLRAAVVKTLLQIDSVNYVSFSVEGTPLTDKHGSLVGNMNMDSFVENPESQINSSIETILTLYFASEDGTQLVKENRKVHYSSNISLEKLVMEKLIQGPMTAGLKATIPAATKLITVSVMDGVCYVNMDNGFLGQNEEIPEQLVLYSIVNSLTALDSVDKVQISINGDTSGKCRYNYDLSNLYEADPGLVQNEITEQDSEDIETTEE